MSETNEPSYYEIALTNRQVVVAFVLILSCVLVAFLAGVWLGRDMGGPLFAQEMPPAPGRPAPADSIAEIPAEGDDAGAEFQFFSEPNPGSPAPKTAEKPLKKPDLRELYEGDEKKPTTLAEDVGSAPPPSQAPAVKEPAPPPKTPRPKTPPPPAAKTVEKPVPPTKAPPAKPVTPAAEAEIVTIQVFSGRDEAQAKKVHQKLEEAGLLSFLSPIEVDGMTMHRVRVGRFRDKEQADKVADNIRKRFKLDTWVTAESN